MKYNEQNSAYYCSGGKEKLDMLHVYKNYQNSKWDSPYDAYDRPSFEKVTSFNRHILRARNIYSKVFNPKVISKNCNFYTMGYLFTDNETGEMNFMLVTPTKNRYIHLNELRDFLGE